MREFLLLLTGAICGWGIIQLEEWRGTQNELLAAQRVISAPEPTFPVDMAGSSGLDGTGIVVIMPSCEACTVVEIDWRPLQKRTDVTLLFPDESSRREFSAIGSWNKRARGIDLEAPGWLWDHAPAFLELRDGSLTKRLRPAEDLGVKITRPTPLALQAGRTQ